MKINYWKAVTIVLVIISLLLLYPGRPVAAQDNLTLELELQAMESKLSGIADDVHVFVHGSGASEASRTETYHVTKVDDQELSSASKYSTIGGNVRIPGNEVKGFSCVSDVHGDLDKGDGDINSDVTCYILSK
jgi:hypothetical protein